MLKPPNHSLHRLPKWGEGVDWRAGDFRLGRVNSHVAICNTNLRQRLEQFDHARMQARRSESVVATKGEE